MQLSSPQKCCLYQNEAQSMLSSSRSFFRVPLAAVSRSLSGAPCTGIHERLQGRAAATTVSAKTPPMSSPANPCGRRHLAASWPCWIWSVLLHCYQCDARKICPCCFHPISIVISGLHSLPRVHCPSGSLRRLLSLCSLLPVALSVLYLFHKKEW